MRTIQLVLVLAMALPLAPAAPPAGPPAGESPPAVTTTRAVFDVFAADSGKKVGAMTLRVTEIPGSVVLETDFASAYKGGEAGYRSVALYRLGAQPVPVRSSAATRIDQVKLMEGTAEFPAEDASTPKPPVKVTVTGYADLKKRLRQTPEKLETSIPVPDGLVLTYPAFVFFAPRVLSRAGRLEGVVYAKIPKDLGFPELVEFVPGCTLVRTDLDDRGNYEVELRQDFPGGNFKLKASAKFDPMDRLVETTFGQWTIRPAPADSLAK